MKILAFDTAMAACSVAVVDTERELPLAAVRVPMERGHAEALAPMIRDAMSQADLGFRDLGAIAVTRGPGTFTGVRIGLSMARGLGLALSIPVAGIDTLTAIAANERERSRLLVASDARNDEIYAALYDETRQILQGPSVMRVVDAALSLASGTMILGTAAQAVHAAANRSDLAISAAESLPDAAAFARMAVQCASSGMPSPLYLRMPDAKPQTSPLRPLSGLDIMACGGEASGLLAEIHQSAFDHPWSEQSVAELLAMPGAAATVASAAGEALGFLMVRRAADEAEVVTLAVRPEMQRRGVARALMDRQIAEFARAGVRRLFLEVAEGNAAALGLYASLGFSPVGRRRNYYARADGAREDAIVMQRQLAA